MSEFCCNQNCNQGRNCPLTDGEIMKKSHYTTPRTYAECEFSGRDTTQGYSGGSRSTRSWRFLLVGGLATVVSLSLLA